MEMITANNKKMLIIIAIIITTILSSTYAFLNLKNEQNTASTTAGCFEVDYSASEITTSSLVSTAEVPTTPISQITLSKDETCKIYTEADIYIHTNTEDTSATINDPEALKYKIYATDANNNVIINQTGNITTTTDANGNIVEDLKIATVTLSNTPTNYDIYIWVDKNISQGAYNGATYSGYIYAESRQSSTVK